MSELVYRKPCGPACLRVHLAAHTIDPSTVCLGYVEQVLDPDKVLWENTATTVADVLAVLDGEDT